MTKEKQPDKVRAPRSSLRSRFVGRKAVAAYFRHSGRYDYDPMAQGLFATPEEEGAILKNPTARKIITNDGKSTYLVHSTHQAAAESIAEHGLGLKAEPWSSTMPNLVDTTKMLARHNEPGSVARNTHGLAYRYEGYKATDGQFKIVAELGLPNPGTSLNKNPYKGTALEVADGVNIVSHPNPAETTHGMPFSIPSERILGAFNVATGDFIPNERFVPLAQHAGATALQEPWQG